MKQNKLLAIVGPTATGKTDLGLTLAKKFNGEIISADSRQVYLGLDLGTGKLPGHEVEVNRQTGYWEMDGIKVWMLDVADPTQQYSVKEYIDQARPIIEKILKRGKLPVIVGGTGLYIKALLEGLSNLAVPDNPKLREELSLLSLQDLQAKLRSLSIKRWNELNNSDRQNPRRLLRSIEIILMVRLRPSINSGLRSPLKSKLQKFNILKIGLSVPRQVLNQRIDLRLASRINQGMIEEAQRLYQQGLNWDRMRELGLEYRYLADYLEKKLTKEQFISVLSNKIHQYAKRQMTWFKKDKNIVWFDITILNYQVQVEKMVGSWYDLS